MCQGEITAEEQTSRLLLVQRAGSLAVMKKILYMNRIPAWRRVAGEPGLGADGDVFGLGERV